VLPAGLALAMMVEAVRKYLDAHPETPPKPAPLLTYHALKNALPALKAGVRVSVQSLTCVRPMSTNRERR
jgi:hypothetical protein